MKQGGLEWGTVSWSCEKGEKKFGLYFKRIFFNVAKLHWDDDVKKMRVWSDL